MKRILVAAVLAASCVASCELLLAADISSNSSQGAAPRTSSLAAIVQAEMNADFALRSELLASSDLALAKSLSGKILQKDGKWLDISDTFFTPSKNHSKYYARRAQMPPNIAGHLELAKLCMDLGLADRARSHMEEVINLDPNHEFARAALGHVRVDDIWLTTRDQMEIASRLQYAQASVQQYGKAITQIVEGMASSMPRQQDAARRNLRNIDAIDALPAIESMLVPTASTAHMAVEWIADHNAIESSQALARIAVGHPDEAIRLLAVQELSRRSLEEFVPLLLKMLSSEISAQYTPMFDRNGRLTGFRKAYREERFDANIVRIVDNVRVSLQAPVRDNAPLTRNRLENVVRRAEQQLQLTINSAVLQARYTAETIASEKERVARNQLIQSKNRRVLEVLSAVADQTVSDEEEAWQWWDDTNYSGYELDKPTYANRNLSASYFRETNPPPRSHECFAAGTPVLTEYGEKPIESIVTGDRVLTSNLLSGLLEWKTVVRATQRPASETVIIGVGNEKIRCTKGHMMWLTGSGWTRAADLKVGDILFGASQAQVVQSIEPSPSIPTFNLQVTDNSNYFVGNNRLLSHDVTRSNPLRQPIPGYNWAQTQLESQHLSQH